MKRLVSGRTLPTHSPLHRLDPYIDDDGLLVVGGRLRHSGLQLSAKHPCILPYRHTVSSLVARSVHERCHLGREWVVSLIRKSYWIINVRSLVYKTCKDCVTCKKLFAPSAVQKMADLPEERLQYDKLPFHHIIFPFGGSNYDFCTHGRVSGPSSLLDLEVMAPRGYSVPCQF